MVWGADSSDGVDSSHDGDWSQMVWGADSSHDGDCDIMYEGKNCTAVCAEGFVAADLKV